MGSLDFNCNTCLQIFFNIFNINKIIINQWLIIRLLILIVNQFLNLKICLNKWLMQQTVDFMKILS